MNFFGYDARKVTLAALAAGACSLGAISTASAVDIEDNVGQAAVEPRGKFFDREQQSRVALVGIEQCQNLFREADSDILFSFAFSTNLNLPDGNTTADVDSVRVFAVDTESGPDDFDCDFEQTDNCNDLLADRLDQYVETEETGSGFDIKVEFDALLEQAVEGLEEKNGISLLRNEEACQAVNVDQQYFVRVLVEESTTEQGRDLISDAVLELDTRRPIPPAEVTSVAVTENNLFLTWEQNETDDLDLDNLEGRASFVAFYSERDIRNLGVVELQNASDVFESPIDLDDEDPPGATFSGNASLDDGIDTDDPATRIFVAVASRDDVGNASEPTFAETETGEGFEVLPVIDFWERYKDAGGAEAGGCSATPLGPASAAGLLLGMLGLGWAWRRRR